MGTGRDFDACLPSGSFCRGKIEPSAPPDIESKPAEWTTPSEAPRAELRQSPDRLPSPRAIRRHRSGSPALQSAEGSPPLKKQNSMGLDAGTTVKAEPEKPATSSGPGAASDVSDATQHKVRPGAPHRALSRSANDRRLSEPAKHSLPMGPMSVKPSSSSWSPGNPTTGPSNACPPFGSKSVIGRRSKMEDACVVVPRLLSVMVNNEGREEVLPPRVAPLLKAWASGPPYSSAGAEGADRHGLVQGLPISGAATRETLHFFGVFDGHGGADAALHCSRVLHSRVRETFMSWAGAGDEAAQAAAMPAASVAEGQSSTDPATPTLLRLDLAESAERGEDRRRGDGEVIEGVRPLRSSAVATTGADDEAVEAVLTRAFHLTDDEFGRSGGYEQLALVGTTAVVVLVGASMLYVANAGDSRVVLCRGGLALPLTDDHKAAREDETARVEAAGGQILFWNGVRVMGLLAVSRAIGDHSLRPYVIAEPEVTIVARHAEDELLVMASDGLWDVMSNQEACTLAKKCLQRARQRGSTRQSAARVAATVLTRAAVDRGSRDNVTVVVVDLSPPGPQDEDDEPTLEAQVLGGVAEMPASDALESDQRGGSGGGRSLATTSSSSRGDRSLSRGSGASARSQQGAGEARSGSAGETRPAAADAPQQVATSRSQPSSSLAEAARASPRASASVRLSPFGEAPESPFSGAPGAEREAP
ncbi:hypothetical protein QBZ16_005047 [Prototheca wickerhamii]|uniref:protein-serine/threonine phosphatase n=1 Tax=Prototheca wickerhamii TaxID=3111 RepID=A0AAD9IEH1_PROWI|nr:hypothetical protein QBZ16_005047 [Prototheca wickerhamii]